MTRYDPDNTATFQMLEQRQRAEERPCPRCSVPAGQRCINPRTGKPYRHVAACIERMKEPA